MQSLSFPICPSVVQPVNNFIQRASGSYLFKTALLGALTTISGAFTLRDIIRGSFTASFPTTFGAALATKLYVDTHWKYLRSEWKMHELFTKHLCGKYSWWDEIVKGKLTLGAIPFANFGHEEQLKNQGITHILSVVENQEFDPKILVIPLKPAVEDTTRKQLSTPDLQPVPIEILEQGVEWVACHINQGKNVYVHCKSGKGRSAAIVLAFLAKYGEGYLSEIGSLKQNSPDAAAFTKALIAYVKKIRPQISIDKNAIVPLITYIQRHVSPYNESRVKTRV